MRSFVSACVSILVLGIACVFDAFANPPHVPAPDICDEPGVEIERGKPPSAVPVHYRIAAFLRHSPQSEFYCNSKRYTYEGRREGKMVRVVSRHRKNGKPHANVSYGNERNHGEFLRHGVMRAHAPDGKVSAIEYHCYGMPVGFHRYFDDAGRLRVVADYSKSDYEVNKARRGKHQFRRNTQTLADGPMSEPPSLFLEVYAVDARAVRRERFLASTMFREWIERDAASTIPQWTQDGAQGAVAWYLGASAGSRLSDRWEIRNTGLQYTAFAEIWQRHKAGLPGLVPARPFNTDILQCPWIDEAMDLATSDKRFALTPVKAVTPEERDVSPQAIYAGCIRAPTVDCLLALAVGESKVEGTQSEIFLRGTAVAATHAGRPRHAVDAMSEALGRTHGYPQPNPLFAAAAALKADAEAAIGDEVSAARSLDLAYVNATTKQRGYEGRNASAIMLAAPILARRGRFEQVRIAYEMAVAERAPRAYEILGELGIALARAGRVDDAFAIAAELRKPPSTDGLATETRPGGEKLAGAVRALTGNPFASTSRLQSHLLALSSAAAGAAERNRGTVARKLLAEVENGLRGEPKTSSIVDMIKAEAAWAYLRTGDVERGGMLLQDMSQPLAKHWADAAAGLCASGDTKGAQSFLERAASLVQPGEAVDLANLAYAYAQCGEKKRAHELFGEARAAADATATCRGDVCDPAYRTRAQESVGRYLVDSGAIDLAEGWRGLGRSNAIRLAAHRGRAGDTGAALKQLNTIADDGKSPWPLAARSEIASARGVVLAAAGRYDEAGKAFDEALRDASAIQDTNQRALALIELAHVQSKALSCEPAQAALRAARSSLYRTFVSSRPPIDHSNARALAAVLAKAYAACDDVGEAREIAHALLLDAAASGVRSHQGASLADAVVAEVAVARAAAGHFGNALKMLDGLRPVPEVLHAALRIETIARERGAGPELTTAQALLADLAKYAEAYFLDAETDLQRRQLIGYFADIVRRSVLVAPEAARLFALLVAESDRVSAVNWHARGLCELGYTAQASGRADAQALFERGIAVAKGFQDRFFPLDVGPSGACAYWLKLSGNEARARSVVDEPIEPLRKGLAGPDPSRRAYPGTLLRLAVSYAEAESGEIVIDWPRLVRD